LLTIPSTYDLSYETNYHTFMLGLLCGVRDTHFIISNREVGLGKPDVLIIPKNKEKTLGIILEFKYVKPKENEPIEKLLEQALDKGMKQIDIKSYDVSFNTEWQF
jgi:hypothetical protein